MPRIGSCPDRETRIARNQSLQRDIQDVERWCRNSNGNLVRSIKGRLCTVFKRRNYDYYSYAIQYPNRTIYLEEDAPRYYPDSESEVLCILYVNHFELPAK
ncbi:hypothetical protein Pan189_36330 [Stratiformator vulcanicus]|uniref:Uncharacterized protein n=1 Tax=Stratiformator vulcanicus TaxID=2527980 RepID=A0A517R5U3_9PLAN|nr:hypothetical protein Pan189_36330 [Stratiformator vulcanicus]